MIEVSSKYRVALICTGLAVVTVVAFWPALEHGFTTYDDDKYVTENQHVPGGITGICRHPLTPLFVIYLQYNATLFPEYFGQVKSGLRGTPAPVDFLVTYFYNGLIHTG